MSALPSRPSRKRQTAFSNCWPRRLLSTVRSCRRIDTSRLTLEACGLTPGGAIARPAALVKATPIQSKKPLPIARRFGEPRTTCSQRGGWGRGASGCGSRDAGTAPLGQSMSRTCPDHCPGHGTGQQPTPLWGGCPVPLSHGGLGARSWLVANGSRSFEVFAAPGTTVWPRVVRRSRSSRRAARQRWDTVRDMSPAVKLRPRANDLIGIATRRDHGRGWP